MHKTQSDSSTERLTHRKLLYTLRTAWTTSGCHTSHTQHTALSRGAFGGAFPHPTAKAGPNQKPPALAALP